VRIVHTETLTPNSLGRDEALWVYNAIDCMVTREVLDALLPQLTPTTEATYKFSKSLQGVILDMATRGILVDQVRRDEVIVEYRQTMMRIAEHLNRIIREGVGFDFEVTKNRTNFWPSDRQLQTLFYEVMGLPTQWKRGQDGRKPTVDRGALEALQHYFYAEPLIRHIFALRDLAKKVQFLSTAIDRDGRIRTSFNIAGTTTGRLASSYSDFGTGTNLQNVENKLRSVFVADPGWKFCNIDLEQSDSRAVGAIHWNLFRDPRYLDACESGDLHTEIAKIAFPSVTDRATANERFYREFSYRDAAKRLGHGSNYGGQPEKMSKATHIPISDIRRFQSQYLSAFPSFHRWWEWVANQIKTTHVIETFLGRRRQFFGHHLDSETTRAAIAYEPQSVTADTINRGMLAVWRTGRVQLLLQVHDSILFQYRESDPSAPSDMLALVQQTVPLAEDRPFTIPAEAKVGWNWSDDRSDPDSLRKWPDSRVRSPRRTRFSVLGL
jgi:DNA polymerase-1